MMPLSPAEALTGHISLPPFGDVDMVFVEWSNQGFAEVLGQRDDPSEN